MATPTPRFRKELPAAATETDGVPCVQVTDPQTGTSFTFYEFEYDLAHQLDGQEVDDVIAWAVANYQTALTPGAIDEFAAKLGELGFLEGGSAANTARPRAESAGAAGVADPAPADSSGVTELPAEALTELEESAPVSSPSAASSSSGI